MRLLLVPMVAVFALGCDPEYSDLEQWELDVSLSNSTFGVERPSQVLVGSSFLIDLAGRRGPAGEDLGVPTELRACVELGATGAVEWVDIPDDELPALAQVGSAGPGTIVIPAPLDACPDYVGPGADLVADGWSLVGVEPSETTGAWTLEVDYFARALHSSGPVEYPPELGAILGPTPIGEGGSFTVVPMLTKIVDGQQVEVRMQRDDFAFAAPAGVPASLSIHPYILGTLDAGVSVDLHATFSATNDDVPLPTLTGIDNDRVTSLELVGVYDRDTTGERGWGLPVGVIAIAKDAEGRRVVGAPVDWSVTKGVLWVQPTIEVSDVLGVSDTCRTLPIDEEDRDATIEARLGDVVASVDLQWTARHDEDLEIDPDSPLCRGSSCSCSSAGRPGESWIAVFGLVVLGAIRRRRR